MSDHNARGFTLIEMIIVVAISAMLSAFAITYSRIGQDQVSLSVEAAKISQIILQAKELAVSTYSGVGTSCAYGVVFNYGANPQTYSLFTYSPPLTAAGRCPSGALTSAVAAGNIQPYAQSSWNVPVPKGVVLSATAPGNDVLTLVLFYPPLPLTFISRDGGASFLTPGQTSKVYLATANGSASEQISVSPAGQIGF